MLKATMTDGHGRGYKAKVNGEGELHVVQHPHPPRDEEIDALPFRQYFTDDGKSSGDNNMVVTSETEFYIAADDDEDIWIKTISVQVSDNGANLDNFGALAALTNGLEFKYSDIVAGDTIIQEAIKTNLDFIRLGLGVPAIGTGTNAFKADISGGGADTYLPVIDLSNTFGLPWGVRLRKGSTGRLTFTVRDNLTGIDTFNIIGYGIRL